MTDTELLIRLTPKKAPFRRGGVHFPTLAQITMPASKLHEHQALSLASEPLIDMDISRDGGEHWRRFSMETAASLSRPTDAAHSPERAVDPTAAIVPTAPIETDDGDALPPQAADPAVPVARPAPIDGEHAHAHRPDAASREAGDSVDLAEHTPGASLDGDDRGDAPIAGHGRSGKPARSR